jgi:membrane protease YdiL (CAAX protease family)
MDSYSPPSPADLKVLAVLLGGTLAFCVSRFGLDAAALARFFRSGDERSDAIRAYWVSKSAQGVLLGGAALLLGSYAGLDMSFLWPGGLGLAKGLGLALGIWVLMLPLLFVSASKPEIQRFYPELRVSPRDRAVVLKSAAGWAIFLTGYELLFRGLLLHYGVEAWGLWPGIAVMTALYVLAHVHKPASEAIACFVVGPAFAFLTLETEAIWPVALLHVLIAVTNENLAARLSSEPVRPAPD